MADSSPCRQTPLSLATAHLDGVISASVGNPDSLSNQASTESSNEHAKACCLPPELTIEIFWETQRIWPPLGFPGETYEPGWMTVLHVCSVWRRVALSAPILWQNIEAIRVHPESIAELLARSLDLPLYLTLDALYANEIAKIEAKLISVCFNEPIFRRLESLAVRKASPKIYEALRHQISLGTPSLQRLGFAHADYLGHTTLLDGLHPTSSPRLCQLNLYGCTISHGFSVFASTLTHLKLERVQLKIGSHLISVKDTLLFLSTLSSLEYIDLHVPNFDSAGDASLQKVTMPSQLKYMLLDVYVATSYAMDLLPHLSVPVTADMNVILTRASRDETDDEYIAEQLFSLLFASDLANGHVIELEIREGYPRDFQNIWYMCSLYTLNMQTQEHGPRRLDLAHGSFIDLITKYRPQSLVLSRPYMFRFARQFDKQVFWDDEFRVARDARHLTICFLDHQLLWLMLAKDSPSALPLLDTVIFTSTSRDWEDAEHAYKVRVLDFVKKMPAVVQHDIEASVLSDLVNGLVKAVELRRHSGKPLREVRIDQRLARWDVWDEVRAVIDVVVV